MAIDSNGILRGWLVVSGTTLNGLVGTRVYAGYQPAPEQWSNTTPAVICWRRAGSNDRDIPLLRPSYQVECYGGSKDPLDAEAVYDALRERLQIDLTKPETIGGGVLVSAQEEAGGQDMIDDTTGWPLVMTFWQIECHA